MLIYTVLTEKSPQALQGFVDFIQGLNPTGVSIFTSPEIVAAPPFPEERTEAHFLRLADAAGAKKDYTQAAKYVTLAESAKKELAEHNKKGIEWMRDILAPIKNITNVLVLGPLQWPPSEPFTPAAFLGRIGAISAALTSTGIGGVVHQTSLLRRVYIPIDLAGAVIPLSVSSGRGAAGSPSAGVLAGTFPHESPGGTGFPSLLAPEQVKFATFRLGLDPGRGGKRRTVNEAGNMMGLSAFQSRKTETAIREVWPEFEFRVNENGQESNNPAPAQAVEETQPA